MVRDGVFVSTSLATEVESYDDAVKSIAESLATFALTHLMSCRHRHRPNRSS